VRKAWTGADIVGVSNEECLRRAEALYERIGELIGGEHPAVQGLALTKCMAMTLAGHQATLRAELLAHHVELIAAFVPEMAAEIWGNIVQGEGRA
jgi:hypothetical protein